MFKWMHTAVAAVAMSVALAQPAAAQTEPVTVFAAASLKDVLETAGKAYAGSGGGEVRFAFAASSALAKQIESGAPADLFASADLAWMDYLAGKQLIQPASRIELLGNHLVVVAPAASAIANLPLTVDGFTAALGDGRLVTGEIKSVPVGRYAKAALEKLGLWATVEPKLAQSENVRAALLLVSRGEAPLGIVYETDAHADAKVKIVATLPETSHDPVTYPFALTATAKGEAPARFLAFLRGPAAKVIFETAGFQILAGTATQ